MPFDDMFVEQRSLDSISIDIDPRTFYNQHYFSVGDRMDAGRAVRAVCTDIPVSDSLAPGTKVRIHDYETLSQCSGIGDGTFFDYAGMVVTISHHQDWDDGWYRICEDDGEWSWSRSMFTVSELGDFEIPETRLARCQRCSHTFVKKYESTENLCENCRKRNYILPYHRWYPELEFYGVAQNKNQKQLFLGVELEVGVGGEWDSSVEKIMPLLNQGIDEDSIFAYCSHDGSIDDGFEIITQPATIKYHKNQSEMYGKLFKRLIEMGYRSHNARTCGIHVHFNRDYYEENDDLYCARLVFLIEKFWDEIVIFSRRDKYRMDRYTKKIDCECNDFVAKYNKTDSHEAHYYAINLANKNTIEFRMFRGTLNLDTFIAILEFVNNCVKIAKNNSTEDIQKMEFMDILTTNCKSYYRRRLVSLKLDEV